MPSKIDKNPETQRSRLTRTEGHLVLIYVILPGGQPAMGSAHAVTCAEGTTVHFGTSAQRRYRWAWGNCREIAAICAGRLRHLVGGTGRAVLRAARPARRDVGPDRPERGGRHRRGRGDQPPAPQAAVAPARRRADQLRGRSGQLPGGPAHGDPAPVPVVRGRAVPADLWAVYKRAAGLYLVPHARPGPAQPHRRADPDRGAGPAAVDLPGPALRAQSAAVLAAQERRHRLPARQRARTGHAGPAARTGGVADQGRGVPDPGCPRGAGLGRRLRRDPAARDVPQRHRGRPRLGRVLRRMGRRGAASHDDRPHQAGDPAACSPLTGQADRAHARLADRPGRAVHRVVPVPGPGSERDRGVRRAPLPARAVPAVGRGRLVRPGARPGAGGAAGRGVPGVGDHRRASRGRRQVRDRHPARPGARTATCCSRYGPTARSARWPQPPPIRGR